MAEINLKFPDSVPLDHIDTNFLQGMLDRMANGYFNHGHFRRQHNKPDFIECLHIRLREYKKTGNTEFLMDAANFCMGEFMMPSHEQAYFESTTDKNAPGVVCGGIFSKQAKVHRAPKEGD
jgi:hypothetical protein